MGMMLMVRGCGCESVRVCVVGIEEGEGCNSEVAGRVSLLGSSGEVELIFRDCVGWGRRILDVCTR